MAVETKGVSFAEFEEMFSRGLRPIKDEMKPIFEPEIISKRQDDPKKSKAGEFISEFNI